MSNITKHKYIITLERSWNSNDNIKKRTIETDFLRIEPKIGEGCILFNGKEVIIDVQKII